MKDNLISIIVPIYNVEKYISQCIESIIKQNYIYWELLLIDDCSTDNSLSICKGYEKSDKRIKVFKNEKNSGPSKTRNYGISKANGTYIVFVDSDDWISVHYLNDLIVNNTEKSDWVVSSYCTKYFNLENKKLFEKSYPVTNKCYTNNEKIKGIQEMDVQGVFFTNVAKLYKSSIIKKHQIFFNENFSISEDILFNFEYTNYINGDIIVINNINYNYRQIIGGKSLIKKFNDQLLSTCLILLNKREKLLRLNPDSKYKDKLDDYKYSLIFSNIINLYKKDANLTYKNRIKNLCKIREIGLSFKIRKLPFSLKNKIVWFLLLIDTRILDVFMSIYYYKNRK